MSKTPARKSARRITRTPTAPKTPSESIALLRAADRFDEAYERAIGSACVLAEFSWVKAGGDTSADDRNLWQGLARLADGLCSDLQQLKVEEATEANYIFNLEYGRPAGRGERQGERRTGGAA